MATDRSPNQPAPTGSDLASSSLSPAMRKRLVRCYERGKEVLRQEKPDRDYAHTMFTECVLQDPSNLEFVEAMLENLQRKFNNNKRGARLKGFGGRGGFKKAAAAEDWSEVFRQGLDLLKVNPWDVATLRALAYACQANHYNEVELRYLKNALDVKPKDIEINRHCAESLARMGQFDQAIACWHRLEETDKGNSEARKKISELTLAKTRGLPGVDATASRDSTAAAARSAEKRSSAKSTAASRTPTTSAANDGSSSPARSEQTAEPSADKPSSPTTHEPLSIEALEVAVGNDEADLENYVQLAEAYGEAGRFRDALQTFKKALEASGGHNLAIREKLEDAQIRMVRAQVAIAEQRSAAEQTAEAADLVKRFRAELNRQEMQILGQRVDRCPDDLALKYELGIRLKKDGNYHQARQSFEAARADTSLKAAATLEMGECFQHLKQYGNAIKCYQAAATEAAPGSPAHLLALYRIGVLAAALKNLEAAVDALTALLEIDPQYRDAAARLDKLKQIGDSS